MRNPVHRPPPRAPLTAGLANSLDAARRAFDDARLASDPVASRSRTAAQRRVYEVLGREASLRGPERALRAARRWYQDVPVAEGAPERRRPELVGEAEALERVLELGGVSQREIAHLARIRPRWLDPGFVVS